MDAHSLAVHGKLSPSLTDTVLSAALNTALAHEFQSRSVADLEQECRQLVQHTALTCIELGKRLCFLKSTVRHGEWLRMIERIGINKYAASRLIQVAVCFLSQPDGLRIVEAAKSKSKLLELLALDEEEVCELARGGRVRGITMETLPGLTVAKLRVQLRRSALPKCAVDGTFKPEEPKCGVDAAFDGSTPHPDTQPNNVVSFAPPQAGKSVDVDRFERRKQYCRELCRVLLRYASEAETRDLAHQLEDMVADQLASRYSPGLNAAAYDVFARYGLKGGAQ
ncbi:DUF3102 domain-containing protein [Chromobacterium sp. LK1]|uniref:DUF3102 domain-containing protein n=1 Tax=Chromobacterium sp. LK1 TaxID=1628193 RepID=UPI00069FFC57|nr:DUF3102 domain-containing protein [Chromobacterium sp. LK1]